MENLLFLGVPILKHIRVDPVTVYNVDVKTGGQMEKSVDPDQFYLDLLSDFCPTNCFSMYFYGDLQ